MTPTDPAAHDQPPKHEGKKASKKRLERALEFVQHEIEGLLQRKRRIGVRLKRRRPKATAAIAMRDRAIHAAKVAVRARLPYVWGGAHTTPAPTPAALKAAHSGYDCSSYACYLDQAAGINTVTGTTYTMAEPQAGLAKGEGRYITHFIKNDAGNVDSHVITRFTTDYLSEGGKIIGWTEAGGRDNTNGGGPCWFTPDKARIAEFPGRVHPSGL